MHYQRLVSCLIEGQKSKEISLPGLWKKGGRASALPINQTLATSSCPAGAKSRVIRTINDPQLALMRAACYY